MQTETLQRIFDIAPFLFFWGIFLYSISFFLKRNGTDIVFLKRVKILLWATLGFRVFYALAASITQYIVWSKNPMTRVFLESGIRRDSPIAPSLEKFPFLFGKLGYFLFYSYGRFWLNVIIVFACVFVFWWFLKLLRKWKERFFEDGEIELGAFCVALIGWPAFVLFLPIAFISVIFISIFRLLFMKEKLTTLGAPFLVAVLLVLIWGQQLLWLTGLSVLKI